jgi:hypothetical protein
VGHRARPCGLSGALRVPSRAVKEDVSMLGGGLAACAVLGPGLQAEHVPRQDASPHQCSPMACAAAAD